MRRIGVSAARAGAIVVCLALTVGSTTNCGGTDPVADGDWEAAIDQAPTGGFVDEDFRCRERICYESLSLLPQEVAVFRTQVWSSPVYRDVAGVWKPHDFEGQRVLDIGTGSGVLALIALQLGAREVVATDINPTAVANANYNAERFGWADRMDVRQVSMRDPGAYAVIGDDERFGVIICNPPWENEHPRMVEDLALYDEGYRFVESVIRGLPQHLTDDGKALLAHRYPRGMDFVRQVAAELDLDAHIHVEEGRLDFFHYPIPRREEDYGEFLPLIELTVP